MFILVINCGSSSLKYQLLDMRTEAVLCKGLCDRIGIEGSTITHQDSEKLTQPRPLPDHAHAFTAMLDMMIQRQVISSQEDIEAVGHRIAQGAERFKSSVIIDDRALRDIEEISHLAPLHNPPQLVGIRSAMSVFGPEVPQVAVFDTTFHQTMPPKAYMYALPYELYEEHAIRRYGFHGSSHRYVAEQAAGFLQKPLDSLKIVTCHLGNGSSIAAVDRGHCVDTSMGLTPLQGLIMGTRSGDVDPGAVCYLNEITGLSGAEMSAFLNKKSGFLGISGVSSDCRDLHQAAEEGNSRAALALDMLAYQIKKFIGSYAAAMGGVDCIVFTGGIGENDAETRRDACREMEFLGVEIDEGKNVRNEGIYAIDTGKGHVRVLVVPTNEELVIARDTYELMQG